MMRRCAIQRVQASAAPALLLAACGGDPFAHGEIILVDGPPSAAEDPAPRRAVRIVGRTESTDPAGPAFAWSGTQIVARFSGTSIGVVLSDPGNYFEVRLDGVELPALVGSKGRALYPIAADLTGGAHDLLLHRRTEAELGDTRFLGVDLGPGGALLPPPPAQGRHLEIIGDSISTGYGDAGPDERCDFSPRTEDHYRSYGAITARDVGAELFTIAYQGRGIYRNYDGGRTGTLLDLYPLTLPDDPGSLWRSSRWTADAVVINLGTNDFNLGNPDQAAFTGAYLTLLDSVRAAYPTAYVFCALGPLLTDDYPPGQMALTTARAYLTAIVHAAQERGDGRVRYIEFPAPDPADGWGCNYHPSLKTHKKMAGQLTGALRAALGW